MCNDPVIPKAALHPASFLDIFFSYSLISLKNAIWLIGDNELL